VLNQFIDLSTKKEPMHERAFPLSSQLESS